MVIPKYYRGTYTYIEKYTYPYVCTCRYGPFLWELWRSMYIRTQKEQFTNPTAQKLGPFHSTLQPSPVASHVKRVGFHEAAPPERWIPPTLQGRGEASAWDQLHRFLCMCIYMYMAAHMHIYTHGLYIPLYIPICMYVSVLRYTAAQYTCICMYVCVFVHTHAGIPANSLFCKYANLPMFVTPRDPWFTTT